MRKGGLQRRDAARMNYIKIAKHSKTSLQISSHDRNRDASR